MTHLRALVFQNGSWAPIPDGESLDLGSSVCVTEISQLFQSHRPQQTMLLSDPTKQILAGAAVYLSGPYRVALSRANAVETAKVFAVCKTDTETGEGYFYRDGSVPIPYLAQGGDVWSAGDQIWVSDETPGLLTNIKPSNSGNFEVPVGWVLNTPKSGIAYLDLGRGDYVLRIP